MSDAGQPIWDEEEAPVEPVQSAEELAMQEAEREVRERNSRRVERPKPQSKLALAGAPDRSPPHSAEAEEHVIACCLLDGSDTIERAADAGITADAFYFPDNRLLFEIIGELYQRGSKVMLETLAEELKTRRQLEACGGFAYLMQVTGKIPTTAHAGYFIEKVREKYKLRQLIKAATSAVEQAYQFTGGLDELFETVESDFLDARAGKTRHRTKPRGLMDFKLVKDGDKSVLLGDRYMNRGDGGVFSSSSGMGKSSGTLQMAALWSLEMPAFGIKPNGALTSLVVQSEDTEGDVAEVAAGIKHAKNLTAEQVKLINKRVIVHTERVLRGAAFIASLRRLIDQHKPDIVWINPLQAFMDGDVTDGQDLSKFLREGLNGVNEPASFGYMLVHHTTKPATGKDRSERLWHEVMYDMAGGAEIINWARLIMSLRPAEAEGEFNLVLAKRGKRAGVVKEVSAGVGIRFEPTTTIPLKHATGRLEVPGIKDGIPLIFWEPRDPDVPGAAGNQTSTAQSGKTARYQFSEFISVFPQKNSTGLPLNELHRALQVNAPISKSQLHLCLKQWGVEGHVETTVIDGKPATRFRMAF